MAEYTIGIWDILRRADVDLSDMNNMTEASKSQIFGSLINQIDPEYQDQFALGFALHFRQEEIGFETEAEWRFALAEKMINGGEWISQVYEHLNKQIFDQYNVTESDGTDDRTAIGSSHSQTEQSGEGNAHEERVQQDVRSGKRAGVQNEDQTSEANTEDSNVRQNVGTSTSKEKNQQETNTVDNQLQTSNSESKNSHNGFSNDTRDITRTDDLTDKNEYDSASYHRSETVAKDSTTGTTDLGAQTTTNPRMRQTRTPQNLTETVTPNGKRIDMYSDTPQNGLSDVESGKYLTTARVTQDTGGTTTTRSGSEETTTEYEASTEVTNSGSSNGTAHEVTEHVASALQAPDKYGNMDSNNGMDNKLGSDTLTHSGTQKTDDINAHTENSTDDNTGNSNTQSSGVTTGSSSGTSDTTREDVATENLNGSQKHSENSNIGRVTNETTQENASGLGTSDSSSTTKASSSTDGNDSSTSAGKTHNKTVSYMLSAKLLEEARPILNTVWGYFDDIFLQLIGGLY